MEKNLTLKGICFFIATFFYSGIILKKGSGTVGSFVAFLFCLLCCNSYFYGIFAILTFFIGWFCSQYLYSHDRQNKDPSEIVIDEASAIFTGAYILSVVTPSITTECLLINFMLFRIFDIWKPFPIRQIENYMKKRDCTIGFGIMIDDTIAIIAASAIQLIYISLF